MTAFGIIVPARFGSSRLPGKPLRDIAGRPMIQWVCENAGCAGADFVWVATDDERILEAVRAFGGNAMLTSSDHATGTDRLAEVVEAREVPEETIVVNVQGDEPLLDAKFIQLVARALEENPQAGIATLACPIADPAELFNPNVVKVVTDAEGMACYFSRAAIPWVRDSFGLGEPRVLPEGISFLRHVGLYAYRARALTALSKLPQPPVECAESLEQLRALYAGIRIHVTVVDEAPTHGVDTEDDLRRAERWILGRKSKSAMLAEEQPSLVIGCPD